MDLEDMIQVVMPPKKVPSTRAKKAKKSKKYSESNDDDDVLNVTKSEAEKRFASSLSSIDPSPPKKKKLKDIYSSTESDTGSDTNAMSDSHTTSDENVFFEPLPKKAKKVFNTIDLTAGIPGCCVTNADTKQSRIEKRIDSLLEKLRPTLNEFDSSNLKTQEVCLIQKSFG